MKNQRTLIIGANSAIAQAISTELLIHGEQHLILISRKLETYCSGNYLGAQKIQVSDYSEKTIEHAVSAIENNNKSPITRVFICHGILHNDVLQPEKCLESINAASFETVLKINALTPLLWIKYLTPKLTHKHPCKITVFSARIGSISDNNLGGWYSYRASKAALNMMLKTAAIELARRAKNIKLIAFHPGTTDTKLSKPFQKNVPDNKIFTTKFVAQQLLDIVNDKDIDGQLSYLDWQGKKISW
ncbi:SDR family NAD(P)-dependent oxidoreductase [Thalassotalea atypica]|uniref:SDR family NAD(P)-dependent oxidoreductase n=1 Tax=Thalassotalea atypica TaxID=2054316 RepID=UPI002572F02B|nr:SDR family NAD(P)-dependent oxidoreductase [Thalassotalea atypica]